MRFFSRFFCSVNASEAAAPQRQNVGGQSAIDARRAGAKSAGPSRSAPPRDESAQALQANRARCRELIHGVVRETMMRADVLSANYKFKVLALDVRGQQFLIMMDLAADALPTSRWNESEALMVRAAKAIHDLTVTAVYWRINPSMKSALTVPTMAASARGEASSTPPAVPNFAALATPADERTTEPAALSVVDRAFQRTQAPRPEAVVVDDEVAALRQALAKLNRPHAPAPTVPQRPVSQKLTPAGFEDTRGFEERTPGLGVTQYGELT